jgi:membrane protein
LGEPFLAWTARMSTTDLRTDVTFGRTDHTSWWAVAFAAVLLAVSFGQRRTGEETARGETTRGETARGETARGETARGETARSKTAQSGDRAAPEDGRGRSADRPSDIPASGWKDILLRVYHGISEDRILLVAAGVTFYLLLSIFPGIAALVSIYGLFADPADIAGHLDALTNVAPGGAIDLLREDMTRLASNGGTTLGLGFVVSLAVSLWSTNSGVSAIFDALNIVYEEKEKRGLVRFYLTTLTFTLASVAFILLAIGVVVLLPVVLNFIPLPGGTDLLVKIARWPILFVLTALALAVLYRYGPSRAEARWRWITWGSAFATVTWIAASVLFSWYVANFGSYNKTYGSLGAIIGFMTWIWISIIVVLVGAKIDAEMEHQTARETTTGQPKPLGMRGARMADTLGPAQG